jgi:hypothetical protein
VTGLPPEVRYLTRGWERGVGAMFRRDLDGRILVFVYPRPAAHLYHTFFSPTLRMLAIDDAGSPVFDALVPPNRVQSLPVSRLVVECGPRQALDRSDLEAIASAAAACAPAAPAPYPKPIPENKGAKPWIG